MSTTGVVKSKLSLNFQATNRWTAGQNVMGGMFLQYFPERGEVVSYLSHFFPIAPQWSCKVIGDQRLNK